MKTKTHQNAYLIGIKGVAMTSLAVYLKEKGFNVSGSDVSEIFSTDRILAQNKIKVLNGFTEQNISQNTDVVIVTGAHGGATNTEAIRAKYMNIPTYMHGVYLGKIMNKEFGIAVAGCHGKTTTSSILALLLKSAHLSPSYAIGTAYINGLGASGHYGGGKYFVAEADEYMTCPLTDKTPRFLNLKPNIAIITNIDFDHPDEFKDLDQVKSAFIDFSAKIKSNGLLIACIDDPGVLSIVDKFKSSRIITYGFSPEADFRIEKFYRRNSEFYMEIIKKNQIKFDLTIKIPGKHNLANALSAAIVGNELGISWEKIKKYISLFRGSNRRFELIRKFKTTSLFDDYAHHPSEIKATISAIKDWYPKHKLILIFQPHTFSRTKRLFSEFITSFKNADRVYIADIFPSAREIFDPSINSLKLVMAANKINNNASYVKNIDTLLTELASSLTQKSIILTMGAGNLNNWHSSIIDYLEKND